MASCEKCWSDAYADETGDQVKRYHELLIERKDNPCTPEQQAGRDALECCYCGRMTLHQVTGKCTNTQCESNSPD